MAEASRSRVTITLGRSGQVVKRDVPTEFSDSRLGAGSKRSVRDRLGSNSDSSQVNNNKRRRGGGAILGTNGLGDVRIGKDDLRLKLMQKGAYRQAQSNDDREFMDLREKLARTAQPPHNSFETRQRMPESNESSILGRIPLTRSQDDLPRMNPSRSSYSPWTLDHIRQRSPERIVGNSRGLSPPRTRGLSPPRTRGLSPPRTRCLSPPRNVEELQRRPLRRAYDDVRTVSYMSKDVHNAPRPVSTSPYMTKPTLHTGSAKPPPPGPSHLGQLPPQTSIVQKSSYTGEEQQTVDGLLHSLGLGKYSILFKAEEVDMTALKQMGEHDLKELGIPMGPRKKLLLALLPRSKRPQPSQLH